MATTRIMPLHIGKGRTVGRAIQDIIGYVQNPDKTDGGRLIACYECDSQTADAEFLLAKRQYTAATGRVRGKDDVIAYHLRQSFVPGEITPEEANRLGVELARRFTKGKHAFIVATHTDRQHIHNHILYNSTSMDGSRKFRDFWLSGLAVQRLSDVICLEHKLSVIEVKPYRERQKRILYPPRESNRDRLCAVIDNILRDKPPDFEVFLQKLEQEGYEVRRGKYTSVKGKRQKRFIRFRTLGAGYSEEEICAVLDGKAEHRPRQRTAAPVKEDAFQLLIDLAAKRGRGTVYQRWAKKFNLKEMSKTLIFLQENKLTSMDELNNKANAAVERFHELQETIRAADSRMAELSELRTQIIHYAKTREVYAAYRKAGYSKKFRAEHEADILLHQAAKAFFDKQGLKKLPRVKELNAEYATLLKQKKTAYPEYRKARDEMQQLLRAQQNLKRFLEEEKPKENRQQSR